VQNLSYFERLKTEYGLGWISLESPFHAELLQRIRIGELGELVNQKPRFEKLEILLSFETLLKEITRFDEFLNELEEEDAWKDEAQEIKRFLEYGKINILVKKANKIRALKEWRKDQFADELRIQWNWIKKYGDLFADLLDNPVDLTDTDHAPLLTLCPVTWKTLEIAFRYKLL
jgi:hypothetical protein